MSKLKEIKRIPVAQLGISTLKDSDYRIALDACTNEVVISKYVPSEVEITDDCRVEVVVRRSQDGIYGRLMYQDEHIATIDLIGMHPTKVEHGFRLDRLPGAHYSARVFKVED